MRVTMDMVVCLQDHTRDGVAEGFGTCSITLLNGKKMAADLKYETIYAILHNMRNREIPILNSDTEYDENHFDYDELKSKVRNPAQLESNPIIQGAVNRILTGLFEHFPD